MNDMLTVTARDLEMFWDNYAMVTSNARYAYIGGEKYEFIDGELWETEIKPRPENE